MLTIEPATSTLSGTTETARLTAAGERSSLAALGPGNPALHVSLTEDRGICEITRPTAASKVIRSDGGTSLSSIRIIDSPVRMNRCCEDVDGRTVPTTLRCVSV